MPLVSWSLNINYIEGKREIEIERDRVRQRVR